MQHISDWYFSLVFFSSILGIIVAMLLFFANRNESFPSKLLAGYFLCFSILALNYSLMTTRFYLNFPHCWRAFAWASFSFAPFAYLYVRSVLEQSFGFRKWDILLFLPAIIHMLNLLPFYLQTAEEKRIFLEHVVSNPGLILKEPEGILPEGIGAWSRIIIGLLATGGQFLLLKKWKPRIINQGNPVEQNVKTYRWLFLFTGVQAAFYLLAIGAFIVNFTMEENNQLVIFTISSTIVFCSIYLLVKPEILYGLKNWLQEPEIQPAEDYSSYPIPVPVVEEIPVRKNTLSMKQREQFKKAVESHFSINNPFRKAGYTISDLSQELNLPAHQLSAFINQEYGLNFNELINKHRVLFLTEMLKNSPDHFQYTLEALGKMAGFNSRTAFFSAVKKITGKSPSEYFGPPHERVEP